MVSEQNGKVMISTGAADDATMEQGFKSVYQLYTPASRYLIGAVDMLGKLDPAAKKVAIIYEKDSFSLLFGLWFGVVMYFAAVHRVINAPELTTLLATFSVNLMIIGVGTALFSTSPRALDVDLGALRSGAITILGTKAVAVLISVFFAVGLYLFLYRTRLGKSIRAVANNRQAAELMGINSTWVLALSFGVGITMAMASGSLLATLFSFTILSGAVYELKSFVIVVLGGLGNPAGALMGGIVLGLLEGVTSIFVPIGWVPVIEFGVFVLILVVRPTGLFGAR